MIFPKLILAGLLVLFTTNLFSLGQRDAGIDEDPCECGIPRNTSEPRDHSYPWLVTVEHGPSYTCIGSLIDDQHVMTSYDCSIKYVDSDGVHNWASTIVRFRVQENIKLLNRRLPILRVVQRYGDERLGIILLKLSDPVVFEPRIRPICIPDPEYYRTPSNYTFAGWGPLTGDRIKESRMDHVPDLECSAHLYARIGNASTSDLFCARNRTWHQNPCLFADHGGPLMYFNSTNSRYYLSGVASNFAELCQKYPYFAIPLPTISPRIEKLVEKIKTYAKNICLPR